MSTHVVLGDFLPRATFDRLLAYAVAQESAFDPTTVSLDETARSSIRKSRRLVDLDVLGAEVEAAALAHAPALAAQLQIPPFEAAGVEIELVAHEDGAFYRRHIDLFPLAADRERVPGDRMISIVSYAFGEPAAFTGGELRLYPSPDPRAPGIDVAPKHGMTVAFSSWLPHEVMPVHCASGQFRDARFGLNCWVYRTKRKSGPG